jgi:glyoxylase-like metal-dependent hydrolase (beta-lactamase superfamily II)
VKDNYWHITKLSNKNGAYLTGLLSKRFGLSENMFGQQPVTTGPFISDGAPMGIRVCTATGAVIYYPDFFRWKGKIMEERSFGPVRFLPGQNNGKYPNCHSIYIDGAGVLIDPASDRDRLIRLKQQLGVTEVWLSHWHEDHMTHLDLFEDLPLRISPKDAPMLSDIELFLDGYGFEIEDHREFWRQMMVEQFHYRPRRPNGFFQDGQQIRLQTVTVEVIHTPGHTPGHMSFFFKEPAVLFMGDYDLSWFGPWYGDRDSSIEETIQSVKRLKQVPAKIWLTCHEAGVFENNPGELWDQYLGVIDNRTEKLLQHLATPKTMQEIVAAWIVYGRKRDPEAFFAFAEEALMNKHLEILLDKSMVSKRKNRYYRC